SSQFRNDCVNSTNTYRAQHNATNIHWNSTLASVAQKWTDRCIWSHSGSGFGENLAIGYATVTDAVDGWGDERAHFDFENPHFTEQTGHFSQLVWKASTSIGCARTFCQNTG
ncbi:PR-1-like protein, partial [Rhizodiscina lignyota]